MRVAKVGAKDARSEALREWPARRGFQCDEPVLYRQLVCRVERLYVVQEFVDARAIERERREIVRIGYHDRTLA